MTAPCKDSDTGGRLIKQQHAGRLPEPLCVNAWLFWYTPDAVHSSFVRAIPVSVCRHHVLQLEVPSDYPVLPRYCISGITRTRSSISLTCGRIRGICHNFCDSQLCLTQWNANWAFVLQPYLMHSIVALHVTDNWPLYALCGRADGSLLRDGIINYLTQRITMYVLTDETIVNAICCFSCSVYCPVASGIKQNVTNKSNVTHHILNTQMLELPRSGRVVMAMYPDPVPGEIPYLSKL